MANVITPKDILVPKKTYAQKLREPQWKSFRGDYVKKRGARCESCKRNGIQAELHHLAYESAREPWEYSYEEVVLLCRDCHEQWHRLTNAFKLSVGRMNISHPKMMIGSLSILTKLHPSTDVCFALCQLACEKHTIQRLKMSWEQGIQGFPKDWTALDASEIPSCLQSRKSSPEQSTKP